MLLLTRGVTSFLFFCSSYFICSPTATFSSRSRSSLEILPASYYYYQCSHYHNNHRRTPWGISSKKYINNMASENNTTPPPPLAPRNKKKIHYSPFLDGVNDDNNRADRFDPSTTAMVILNSPIRQPPSPLFERLWTQSTFHICADGGANRLYHATTAAAAAASPSANNDNTDSTAPAKSRSYKPDLITGDLDSLKPKVREFYEGRGVKILQQYDQDYNDLDKSIRSIPAEQYKTCFVYGGFGGRFDQEMASIQSLFTYLDKMGQIWMFDDQNAAILLGPGEHDIYCPNYGAPRGQNTVQRVLGEGPTCGLIPIGQPCQQVTTTGLQWNLNADPLEFGKLVSTSNRIVERKVTVTCSHPLLFTVEVYAGLGDDELW